MRPTVASGACIANRITRTVIGFRQVDAVQRYGSAIARVHATRFEDAAREPPLSYGFSERALSRQWRDEFLREYATRSV